MTLPTSKPNEVSGKLIYPNQGDNSWGRAMNDNFVLLAGNIDTYKIEVKDKVKGIETTVATHFDVLKSTINNAAAEYIAATRDGRVDAMATLKGIIDDKLQSAVESFLSSTQSQLAEIDSIKEILLLGINRIQSEFNLTRGYIESGLDRILRELTNEIETTASTKEELINKIKEVRTILIEHVSNYNNPHEFNGSQIVDGKPVYQPDPTGHDAIMPLFEDDAMDIDEDEDQASTILEVFDQVVPPDLGTEELLIARLNGVFLVLRDVEVPENEYHYHFGAAGGNFASGIKPYTTRFQKEINGDISVASLTPDDLKIVWDEPLTGLRGDKDFDLLRFPNPSTVQQNPVTIEVYTANGVTPMKTIVADIIRENYTDKPTLIDNLIVRTDPIESSSSSGAEVVSSIRSYTSDVLQLETKTSSFEVEEWAMTGDHSWQRVKVAQLFHWAKGPDLEYHEARLSVPTIKTSDEEVSFQVPDGYKSVAGENWSDVEACAFTAANEEGAAFYQEETDSLVLFFNADKDRFAQEYIIKFDDNEDPITDGGIVTVTWRKWNLWDASVDNSYEPTVVAEGTAETLVPEPLL